MLRGVCCCLPVVPRVAAGDSERVPEVPLEGVPDAVFPDLAAGSVALAEGEAVLAGGFVGCCCPGCGTAGACCGSGRPGR